MELPSLRIAKTAAVRAELAHRATSDCKREENRHEIPAWVKIVLSVDDLIREWFGIVNGVRVPSAFSRTIEI